MTALDQLIHTLSRLPGLGRKSASRLAYHLLKSENHISENLGDLIGTLKQKIRACSVCGNYTEHTVCEICSDLRREKQYICVVEQAQDVSVIETSREYRGLYHVLHGVLAPLDGIGPDKLNMASLIDRCKTQAIEEVILATNPTLEGDTTALYIKQLLQNTQIRVTRLALGLPVGGDLEYADRQTLARSLKGRTRL